MRMYLYLSALYFAISMAGILIALSELIFGTTGFGLFAKRVGLSLVWPIAVLSRAGRRVLFTVTGENEDANGGGISGDRGRGEGENPQDH